MISLFLFRLSVEPSRAPENVTALQDGAKRIRVTWKPVVRADRNGNITGYTVYYRAVEGYYVNVAEQSLKVNASVTKVELSQLEEYVTYNVSVSANTRVGEGPRSKGVLETTAEASEYRHN